MAEKQDGQAMGAGVKLMGVMVVLLLVATAVFGVINYNQMKRAQERTAESRITVTSQGGQRVIEGTDVVRVGPEEFTLTTGEEEHIYTGAPLSAVLEWMEVPVQEDAILTVGSSSGDTATLTGQEILEPENAYLVYGRDGDPLELPSKGGNGPYLLVLRKEPDQTRWVRGVNQLALS